MCKLRELERAGLDSDQVRESHDPDPMHLFQTLSNLGVSFFFPEQVSSSERDVLE